MTTGLRCRECDAPLEPVGMVWTCVNTECRLAGVAVRKVAA